MRDSTALRAAVITEALSWIGTPFHDCAGVKGHGVDCAHLVWRCYQSIGVVPPGDPPAYKPQWFQHQLEEVFLQELKKHGAVSIAPTLARAGDVLMHKYGKHAAHGAIVIDERSMVHAYKAAKMVVRAERAEFEGRLDSAWTLFPEMQ